MLAALLQCSAGRQSQSCSIHGPQNARSPGTLEMRDKCVDKCLLTSLGCDLSSLEITVRQFWHRQQSWDSSVCCKLPYFVVKATLAPRCQIPLLITVYKSQSSFQIYFFLFLSCLHWEETCLRNSLAYATTTAIRANLNSQHWDGNRNNNYPAQQIKNRSGKSVISASMTVKKKICIFQEWFICFISNVSCRVQWVDSTESEGCPVWLDYIQISAIQSCTRGLVSPT